MDSDRRRPDGRTGRERHPGHGAEEERILFLPCRRRSQRFNILPVLLSSTVKRRRSQRSLHRPSTRWRGEAAAQQPRAAHMAAGMRVHAAARQWTRPLLGGVELCCRRRSQCHSGVTGNHWCRMELHLSVTPLRFVQTQLILKTLNASTNYKPVIVPNRSVR